MEVCVLAAWAAGVPAPLGAAYGAIDETEPPAVEPLVPAGGLADPEPVAPGI